MTATRANPREAALQVARKLVDAGFTAYFAGGCVRDRLLGIEPKDYAVATDARPEQVTAIFPRARRVGEAFGVMLVRVRGRTVEVATFRTDGVYSDGRRPDRVEYSDAEHDARRRDFTINGLFEDPGTGAVIDFVGGRADLEAGLVRAIGNPDDRLREDRLRMLRAVRFAARFGFAIEPATVAAVRAHAGELPGVSRERIGQELNWMFSHPSRAAAAETMQALLLDAPVLAEPASNPALPRLSRLPAGAEYATGLAAWLLDRHAGRAPGSHPDEADVVSRAGSWSRALSLSNADRAGLVACLRTGCSFRSAWAELGVAARKRLAVTQGFEGARQILAAEDPAAAEALGAQVALLAETGLAPPPLITGDDLVGLGLSPGPMFRRVLDAVYDSQLEGRITDRRAALKLAGAMARMDGGPTAER